MTRAATSDELTALRSDGQWARWKAIIDRPNTLYTARVNGSINDTAWSIPFDGASGTLGDCLADMLLLIGSAAGSHDRGIARLRKAPETGVFYIGADDSLPGLVQDNDYLTVINDFAPMARQPVGESIDVDVAYSDQHTTFIPTPVMGERAAVIYAGDTIGFDASGSWVIGSSISAFSWTFPGATSTTGTDTATPTATYNTSGRFRVKLTVTAANGETCDAYGWVYVLGDNLAPETGVIVGEIQGETGGGWVCQVTAYDRPTIRNLARIVLYSEDYHANSLGSKGPVSGRENILLAGWIAGESIVRAPGQDLVEFTAGGPGVMLGAVAASPAGLVDPALPDDSGTDLPDWSKCSSLTVRKALHHLVHYRSTLARCVDVEVEDWSSAAGKATTDAGDLWGQLADIAAQGAMMANADRYGHIYIERDARLYPLADRAADIPVIMTLTDADWSEELAVIRRQYGETAIAEVEGSLFSGGFVTPVGGRSPGDIRAAFGGAENVSEVSFASAAESLELAGLLAGALNAEYEGVVGILPSNNHFIDVAPRQYVGATVDGETLSCIPRRLGLRHDDSTGAVSLDVDMEPAGGQWPAVGIVYPGEGEAPVEPPFEPTEPPAPPEEPPEEEPVGTGNAVVVTTSDVRTTTDLSDASPTWTSEL